ncbi:thioredoxin family protein [Flavobacterium sediminilitoris]|uniref:Thioredoxin family protein n=1 Tax=Flavobacterium sediminilitoris TaxID=2024526 RepID=A0ABY4HP56_9FLAO|nr:MULTISPECIES: thioredoxin family protein [Flavobacterium]UOX34370.1 thioredoxin family protein [Flavobacterium sediminilitoris]
MKTVIITVLSLITNCSLYTKGTDGKPEENRGKIIIESKEITDGILIGKTKITNLQQEPFNEWYSISYNEYKPNEEIIKEIKKYISDYSITVFMGTWCEDSQNQVPKFFKILNQLDFPLRKVNLITMTRDKTTPEIFEEGLNITNVPTFIFYKKDFEINRIVESPVESLEEDIFKIVSNKPYKHIYAK